MSRCNFPFKYNGTIYFEPVEVNDTYMCSTEQKTKNAVGGFIDYALQENSMFEECIPCSEGEGMVDWSRYFTGEGFALKKKGGNNAYPNLTLGECQELCEITDNCLYFKLDSYPTGRNCQLFYGMGEWRFSTSTFKPYFGHKYNPSI